ncbi:recombinase family protein [Granulicella tundricola]|uniref:Resolvase domain protein n=1 Tax=Granulicella tundricola (strain ATCC BAA-1859 / DSM 23138 / MP5ACTX9) TaxID=1198114 RepID=E8X7H1_GRATM|nr:recombinase family protein [Granulicella tundricola]ADW71405.1 Resolvase domain protein [Granulicella tundricola MP5ACTX9]
MSRIVEPKVTKVKRRVGQVVGYLRVSSLDQKEIRQLDGITLDKRFVDKASGKDIQRPQLEHLMGYVREGDTVVCHAMDRLARNLDDLRKLVLTLTQRGVNVRFQKENLTFTGEDSPMSHLLLSVMGAFAQFERDLIRERQREGIALAKLRGGAYVGRKHSLDAAKAKELRRRVASGESKTAIAIEFGIARQTLYRYVAGGAK